MRVGKSRALTTLAKTTQPAAHRSYARQSLYAVFDRAAAQRVLWLSAPAGYGKTIAVSGYLQTRKKPTIWYQCDDGDADAASFFLHLTFAREQFTGSAWPQAATLAAEHLAEIPTYARNFFRAWFTGLPTGATLVLDNYQDVPVGAALRGALPIIAEQIPEDASLIVISREDPPSDLVRMQANQQLSVIGVHDLQLSLAETTAIVAMQTRAENGKAPMSDAQLYQLTQGWAAGVTLLIRRGGGSQAAPPAGSSESLQALFNYFAVEVFDRLDERIREFLLKTAFLDQITVPLARHLCGEHEVAAMLEALVRQNAFTVFRPGPDSYHYHPLFRDFLRTRLEASMPAQEQRALMLRAAHSLQESKDPEGAIALLLRASQWDEAVVAIVEIAPAMVQQVRFTTLARWLDALPAHLIQEHGWLSYWRGIVCMVTEFPTAGQSLEHAFRRFLDEDDTTGQMLACSGLIQCITFGHADHDTLLPWLDRLRALVAGAEGFPSASLELQITSGLLLALALMIPQHPALALTVARVTRLLAGPVDPSSAASAIASLQHLYGGIGRTQEYGDLDDKIAQVLAEPKLGPAMRIQIMWGQAWQLHLTGDTQQTLQILTEARSIAAHHHLCAEDLKLQICELQAGDSDIRCSRTAVAFAELEPRMQRMPPIMAAQFSYVRAMCEHRAGNAAAAWHYMEHALQLMPRRRWPLAGCLLWLGAAEVHCEAGRFDEAENSLGVCAELVGELHAPLVRFNLLMTRAELARRTADHDAFMLALSEAFAIGKLQGFAHSYHSGCLLLPRLIPEALRLNIEVPYCCWVIEKRRLMPAEEDTPRWPWKIKIRAMGRLDIEVDGCALESSGKTQRKPLQLLKALLARSDGCQASELMDVLWPDLEGDAARNALDLAIHRLRKMLGYREAVLTSQGKIMINRAMVWADAFVLERMRAQRFADAEAQASRLLNLYRGPLLPGDELPMVNLARVRLRGRWVQHIEVLARQLVAEGKWQTLTSLCIRASEVEPAEEAKFRELGRGPHEPNVIDMGRLHV